MDAVENQTQVSHRATALGNRKRRDSHIPTAATRSGKVENEKHVSHFPAHDLVFVFKTQKGDLAADRFAPAPGSFVNGKMLRGPLT